MPAKKINSKQSGFTIVESMIAALILLFVLSAGFILLNSVLVNLALENRREEISAELDNRVNIYRLTGVFNTTSVNGITFKKTVVVEKENDAKPPVDESDYQALIDAEQNPEEDDIQIIYRLINFSGFDDNMGVADRVKVIEREVIQDDEDLL